MVVDESVLEVASVVERLGLDVDGLDKVLVHVQHLLSRLQGQRPVAHFQVTLRFHGLSQLKKSIFDFPQII